MEDVFRDNSGLIFLAPLFLESSVSKFDFEDLKEVREDIVEVVRSVYVFVREIMEDELGVQVLFQEEPLLLNALKTGWVKLYSQSGSVMKYRRYSLPSNGRRDSRFLDYGDGISGEYVYRDPSIGVVSLAEDLSEVPSLSSILLDLDLSESLKCFYDALLGLSFLHNEGLIHGDFKDSNILFLGEGRGALFDFEGVRSAGELGRDIYTDRYCESKYFPERTSLDQARDMFSVGMALLQIYWISFQETDVAKAVNNLYQVKSFDFLDFLLGQFKNASNEGNCDKAQALYEIINDCLSDLPLYDRNFRIENLIFNLCCFDRRSRFSATEVLEELDKIIRVS